MNEAVRCPHCDELSRVPSSAIGQGVECPRCDRPFTATPDKPRRARREVPTVHPTKSVERPTDDTYSLEEPEAPHGPRNVLVGFALLPLLIPILWLLGPMLTGKQAIFTYVLPCAIALSAIGVSIGVVFAADWSFGMRVKCIFAILFLSCFVASFLYFLKTEWVEAFRKKIGVNNDERWHEFKPPDKKYKIRVPTDMTDDPNQLLDGWQLNGFRSADRRLPATFFVAHGRQPEEMNKESNEKFFEEVRKRAEAATGGEVTGKPKYVGQNDYPGFEYVIALPDKGSKRILRVFRVERFAFVAGVEGAFLSADARDVKKYFSEIVLTPSK